MSRAARAAEPGAARRAAERAIPLARRRQHLVAAGIFALLAIGFLNPIFRADATLSDVAERQVMFWPWAATPTGFDKLYPQTDQADTFYPWQVFINRELRSGSVPFWNPDSFGGAAFLTNGQNGTLYPVRAVLALTVSPSWVHDLFILLHLFASGLAMYFLLRQLRSGFLGAVLAGVAWELSSYALAWAQLEHVLVATTWMPVALALSHRAFQRASLASACLAGLALGLCTLGGNLELALLVWVVTILYALALAAVRAWKPDSEPRERLHIALRLAAIPLVGFGTSAVYSIPTLARAGGLSRTPVSYDTLVKQFDVPLSVFLRSLEAPPLPVTAETMHQMSFAGTVVAVLAIAGALTRRPGAALGRWVGVATLLVAVGTPLTYVAYHTIPGFDHFRPLGRVLLLWCFAVALLGGLGLDALVRWARTWDPPSRARRWLDRARLDRVRFPHVAALAAVGAIVFTGHQLLPYGRAVNPPFQPRESAFLYPRTPAIAALLRGEAKRPAAEPMRILPLIFTMGASSQSLVFGIDSAAGYESVLDKRIAAIWRVVQGESPAAVLRKRAADSYRSTFTIAATRFDLLPRLGVTTIFASPGTDQRPIWRERTAPLELRKAYSGPDGQVYDILGEEPRAYVVHGYTVVSGPEDALARFTAPAFDARRALVIERSELDRLGGAAPSTGAPLGPAASVDLLGANDEAFQVRSDRPGWLVIANSWDPGWSARVNGRDAPVLRVNFVQQAVPIPAGASHVELRYRPEDFTLGLVITLLTITVIPGALLIARRRARRTGSAEHGAG